MSVDCVYEILNRCEDARSAFAWMEAVNNAYIPGLGRIPTLDYIPGYVQQKFVGKLTLGVFMRMEYVHLYIKYAGMVDWSGIYARDFRQMSIEFAQSCEAYMPENFRQRFVGKFIPTQSMFNDNISYYKKYSRMIDWEGSWRQHGRTMDLKFAESCEMYMPEDFRQSTVGELIPKRPMSDDSISCYKKYHRMINWKKSYRRHGAGMSPKFAYACQEYMPSYIQTWVLGKLIPDQPMNDANVSYYREYSQMIDWRAAYNKYKQDISPTFAHMCEEYLPKDTLLVTRGSDVPSQPMNDSTIAYYKEHAHTINWAKTLAKRRNISPNFAIACAEYIDWYNCRNIRISCKLLEVIKDKICWATILERHKLRDATLIKFIGYINWGSPSAENRLGDPGSKLRNAVEAMFPTAMWEQARTVTHTA